MPNDRLREALLRSGLDVDAVAKALDVDRKTVERWITKGRTPYPKYRHKIATMTRETESYLWPEALAPERKAETAAAEVVNVFPHRNAVPVELWDRLISGAAQTVGILVHAALFLVERPRFVKDLAKKAEAGATVRLLFGDPDGDSIALRGEEEQLGDGTLAARIRNALAFYRPLVDVDGVAMRFHNTTLYNSIFRFDDEMVINTHVYGFQGARPHPAPAPTLRRGPVRDLLRELRSRLEPLPPRHPLGDAPVARVDHYHDPNAPTANSIAVAVSAFIQDEDGCILMIRRSDNDLYSIPGGQLELGETLTQAAVREVKEETGIDCEVTGLIGIYSNPHHVVAYDDGEVRQEFSICFRAQPVGGQPQTSNETTEVCWMSVDQTENAKIHPSNRLRIEHALGLRQDAFFE
jgi:ADP-ribose pyrophosphatase YjhB (NUDIX family)